MCGGHCAVFLVAFRSIQNIAEEGLEKSEDELSLANFAPDIFRSLPIMSFAFTFHPNIFPIFSEMRCALSYFLSFFRSPVSFGPDLAVTMVRRRNPTMSRMRAVVHAAVLVSGLAYLIVGVFGYLTFLEETEGNIFNNYDDDIFVGTLRCAMHLFLMTTLAADVTFALQRLARSSWPWSSCT